MAQFNYIQNSIFTAYHHILFVMHLLSQVYHEKGVWGKQGLDHCTKLLLILLPGLFLLSYSVIVFIFPYFSFLCRALD